MLILEHGLEMIIRKKTHARFECVTRHKRTASTIQTTYTVLRNSVARNNNRIRRLGPSLGCEL